MSRHLVTLALLALAACDLDSSRSAQPDAPQPPGAFAVQDAYIKASNPGQDDNLGSLALSSDGTTLAIGAFLEDGSARNINGVADEGATDSGAVYVYVADGETWRFQAYIKASNADPGDFFGGSLALSADGSVLAVTSPLDDSAAAGVGGDDQDNTSGQAGSVFVFRRIGEQWQQEAYLKPATPGKNDAFGTALALSSNGTTLVVSAKGESSDARGINGDATNDLAPLSGAVYIFHRANTTWQQQAFIKSSTSEARDQFGGTSAKSIAITSDGNTVAVGAPGEDGEDNATPESGAVYVFTRTGVTWMETARIAPTAPTQGAEFGNHVALSSDGATLAVGAAGEDEGSGAVHVYAHATGAWTEQAHLVAANAGVGDAFGTVALSADGRFLAVGAHREDGSPAGVDGPPDDRLEDAGAVYLFERTETTWSQRAYLKASNAGPADRFGAHLALSADGSRIAVGASGEDSAAKFVDGNQADETSPSSGAVYTFTRTR